MILKRNFDPRKVATYVWRELTLALVLSVGVYVSHVTLGISQMTIPFGILSLLGAALAIFLAFRNNTSFTRWGEAAQLWASIINQCRILARIIITFVNAHQHTPQYKAAAADAFKREMAYRLMAWPNALRLQLRGIPEWDELRPFLSASDYETVSAAHNKPNVILLLMGRQIYDGMATGILQGFDSFQMEGALAQLSSLQAACERLKTIPVPRQYDYFTRLFVLIFIVLTPFGLVRLLVAENVAFLLIPLSVLVAFVFTILERTGEVNEAPFENRITDVPMSAMCRTIERDVRELLGEKDLPPALQPKDGYLY
ncbi:MAG: bestrophin family ion channel [Anaerolineales bacterium]